MPKFPVDAPKAKVVKALELLGFQIVREREHISMVILSCVLKCNFLSRAKRSDPASAKDANKGA